MDAVGFTFPVELASAKKVIGSVTVTEIDPCNSLLREKTRETASWNKIIGPNLEPPTRDNQLPIKHSETSHGVVHSQSKNGLLLTPKAEGVHVERKTGKFSRTSGPCPKRPRVVQLLQDPSQIGIDGVNDVSQKLGSCTLKCATSEKPQLVKQKNNISKRGDKRSPRVPVKAKHDSFSVKTGLTGFGSAAGGNNFFGVYGVKSENQDATKLIEDLPLNELLSGNYQPHSLGKDKGKKPTTGNDSFVDSVRQCCSILLPQRSSQSQNLADTESLSNKKVSPWLLGSISVEASSVNADTEDSSAVDMCSSSSKDIPIKPNTLANSVDCPLYQPLDILRRLTLPPPKDLESLLSDATKPPLSSKSVPDARSGKQVVARRASLPPFQWSNTSNGHCRANSDVVRLSTIKGSCPGRWLRIGQTTVSSSSNVTSCFEDLESLTYDQSLVPSGLKGTCVYNEITPTISTGLGGREWDSVPSCSQGSGATLVCGGKATDPGNAANCPKAIAAAETLYEIATSLRKNLDRLTRWPKKSSQKAMKARKSKSNEKSSEPHPTPPVSSFRYSENNSGRSEEIMIPLTKKPKLSIMNNNNKRDLNYLRKESATWSTPRSVRSSPAKTIKDSIADPRYSGPSIVKHSYTMPPPAPVRVPENSPNVQQKLRKLTPFEWNRGRDQID